MEIIKTNCQYSISDTAENGWSTNGSLTKEVSGNINVNINTNDALGQQVGNYYYNSGMSDMISININVKPELKDEFVTYAEKIISEAISKITE